MPKPIIYTPKRDDDYPRPFQYGSPPQWLCGDTVILIQSFAFWTIVTTKICLRHFSCAIWNWAIQFITKIRIIFDFISRYSEETRNCYDYVINILSEVDKQQGLSQCSSNTWTKEEFCRKFILPVTTKLAKYIEMYRTIHSKGTVVLPKIDTS